LIDISHGLALFTQFREKERKKEKRALEEEEWEEGKIEGGEGSSERWIYI
jgi:hypothetical protein